MTKAVVRFEPCMSYREAKLRAYQQRKKLWFTVWVYLAEIEPNEKNALMDEMRKVYDEVVEVPYVE